MEIVVEMPILNVILEKRSDIEKPFKNKAVVHGDDDWLANLKIDFLEKYTD